jgi:type IV secretory pathway VirD2 relaxase
MARDQSDDFRVRPGRSRSDGTRINPRAQPFLKQVQIAVRRAGGDPNQIGRGSDPWGGRKGQRTGRFNARGRGAKVAASFAVEGRDGGWRRDAGGRFRARRVVVKARVVRLNPQRGSRGPKMRGTAGKAVDAHLRYLERDGVTRDGEKGRAYSAFKEEADGKAFVERGRGDRHQFRFIVAAEDANEIADLRGFTRDLMRQMERDLETDLDWIAVDHHNTGHSHSHIIVRGVLDDGRILNIAGDYIAHGIRHRASELVTLQLGQQSEIELQTKLRSEVEAERWTRLDKMLQTEQREHGIIDFRPREGASYLVRENGSLMIGRVNHLERYGLASEVEPGRWIVSDRAQASLRELSERNDVIKTVHRALADQDLEEQRGVAHYVRHGGGSGEKITGRVLAKGLAGEMDDRVYLVVDGVDGRVHHMVFPDASSGT